MSKVTAEARRELVRAIQERYGACGRSEKQLILDEFLALTGYHRKHAIRVLNGGSVSSPTLRQRGSRSRLYDEAVREALVVLWEASDRICGKRLKSLLPVLVESLERHGHLHLENQVREKLLAVSASTIDRLLAPTRATVRKKRRGRRRPSAARTRIAVRTFSDWKEPEPGFLEVDLVAHCGGSMSGNVAHTLVLTDVATGWTECVALAAREGSLIVEALRNLQPALPFPLLGIDTDNGSEFINDDLVEYCLQQEIEFTRSRPYRKNDQAWVEQKNGSVVRRLVGYGRLVGIAGAEALGRLYGASRLFVNFFQPSFQLLHKERVDGRVRKQYRKPATPCSRLLASPGIGKDMKLRLRAVLVTLDPLMLLDEIRTVQHQLAGLAEGRDLHAVPHRDADLDRFLRSLSNAWKKGEVRPTHQPAPKPKRHWRTRKDPFEVVESELLLWFHDEPDQTARQLLDRLQGKYPGRYPDVFLRTLQRRMKAWRSAAARRLVFQGGGQSIEELCSSTAVLADSSGTPASPP